VLSRHQQVFHPAEVLDGQRIAAYNISPQHPQSTRAPLHRSLGAVSSEEEQLNCDDEVAASTLIVGRKRVKHTPARNGTAAEAAGVLVNGGSGNNGSRSKRKGALGGVICIDCGMVFGSKGHRYYMHRSVSAPRT